MGAVNRITKKKTETENGSMILKKLNLENK